MSFSKGVLGDGEMKQASRATPGKGEVGSVTGEESLEGARVEEELLVLEAKEKGKAATQDCNVSASMFLRHTAVYWMKRSSSRPPCGLGLESPNLSAASSTWQHEATPGFTSLLQLQGYTSLLLSV